MKRKICSKCKRGKGIEHYCKDKTRKDGLHPWCDSCRKARWGEYYKNNTEKILLRIQNQRDGSRENVRNINRKSYAKHKEKRHAHQKLYYSDNSDSINSKVKERRLKNPGYWRSWDNKRTKLLKTIGTHSRKDVEKQLIIQNGKCWYCGSLLGVKYHVDHYIPISRGGSNNPDNIVISCIYCNLSKGNKLPCEFMERSI